MSGIVDRVSPKENQFQKNIDTIHLGPTDKRITGIRLRSVIVGKRNPLDCIKKIEVPKPLKKPLYRHVLDSLFNRTAVKKEKTSRIFKACRDLLQKYSKAF